MTGKERTRAALRDDRTDRTPCFYMGTPQINEAVMRALGTEPSHARGGSPDQNDLAVALGADVIFVRPTLVPGPGRFVGFRTKEVHAHMHRECGYESVPVPTGPLADAESADDVASASCWPDPDWFDYAIPDREREWCDTKFVVARGNNAQFLSASALRGMEKIMMDMALNAEMAHAIFTRIVDFHVARLSRFLENSGELVDIVDIGDDVAGQTGMLFSAAMFREFILPQLERLAAVARGYGKDTLFFGCGGFRDVIPDMADAGIRNIGRLQTEAAGNELKGLVRDFGGRVALWGALDAQHALIEGGPADAAEHVRRVLETTESRDGTVPARFVAGPTHAFTEDTPVENVLACYRALGTLAQPGDASGA